MKQLTIPDKLYGRQNEIAFLFHSFEKISKGTGEILTVPGVSGAGKTALVNSLELPVKNENGKFVSGKFEQYRQNIPYFAFRQALTGICQLLIAEDDVIREQYKINILDAVGRQGQVLVDLVPEFENLLGPQPPLIDISPQEARHRFTNVLRRFLEVICLPEHPLVLFVDDWQWADAASLELLKQLKVGNTLRYILVIVSYRDNEVSSAHPLTTTLDDLNREHVPLTTLKVENLIPQDVSNMLADTLNPLAGDVGKLSGFIHEKTNGNPFFVHAAIHFLFDTKLLWFNALNNKWEWKTDVKNKAEFPGSAVKLFVQKLRGTSKKFQKIISLAACLGNRFSLNNLEIISGLKTDECKAILESEHGKEIVLPLVTENEKAAGIKKEENGFYLFRHDRLQQAAFTLIEKENRSKILLKIGRLLLYKLSADQLNERLFEVMNAVNAGIEHIVDPEEKLRIFRLNMQSARKAYDATAYSASLQYYHAAGKLLKSEEFEGKLRQVHRELLADYLKERALSEFLEGDHNIAEKCVYDAVELAEHAVEKADAYNILIVQHTLQSRYSEAISSAKAALSALGINLPEDNFENARDKEIQTVRKLLNKRTVASLFELPKMTDPKMLMACKILITMGPPCYRSHQKLWSVMVPVVVGLTLRYGNIPQIGYSHTALGGLLGWVDDDYTATKEFSDLATRLMSEKFNVPSDQSVFYLMIGSSARHWFRHLKHSSQDYIDAYEIGLRSGNLQYAAYAFGHNMYCRFYQGVSVEALIPETKRSLEFSKTRHNQWAIDLFTGALKIFNALTTKKTDLTTKQMFKDLSYLKIVDDHHNIQVKCIYKVLKTFTLFMLGRTDEALTLSDETEPIIYTVGTQGLLPWPEHVFARVLILLKLYPDKPEQVQKEWLKSIKQSINKLRIWAKYCPENFEHKYLLAAGELDRLENRPTEALQKFYKAITLASENEFIQWGGLANEMIYNFWLKLKNYHLAFHYWKQAYVFYQQWGAVAKLKLMEADYINYLDQSLSDIKIENEKDATLQEGFKQWLVNKQLQQIQNLAFHLHQSKLRQEAVNHAEELAEATRRLRAEMVIRKKAEDEVKLKNCELEKINAEKDKFFSIISHDLKSPFSSVQGFSDLLVNKVQENDFDDIILFANRIQQSANKAMELLTNLMEWSQAQTGRMKFNPKQFDLTDLLVETELLYENIAAEKNIVISKQIDPSLIINADKAMISTVLRNLISNAIKFTEPGGNITVSAEKKNNKVILEVADSGVGISNENMNKLFSLDENYTTCGTKNEKGTGLGLILCQEFIKQHNGNIDLKSEENKGTKFRIILPHQELKPNVKLE